MALTRVVSRMKPMSMVARPSTVVVICHGSTHAKPGEMRATR